MEATNSRAPLNFFRHLLQHQRQWILLFSGSHQLSELPSYWTDYLINTRALQMTYLQESEARELILQPVEDFPTIYQPESVDAIIQLTCCQPYLVQLFCYELVELLNRDIRENSQKVDTVKANIQDIQKVIPLVLERGSPYFRELWTSLDDSDGRSTVGGERNLLKRLIEGETFTQQDERVKQRLVRKQILNSEGDGFKVPLVQKFVEKLLNED